MLRRLLSGLLLLSLATAATAEEPPPPAPDEIGVATFNIRVGIIPDGANSWANRRWAARTVSTIFNAVRRLGE